MAEKIEATFGGKSAEEIAYLLFQHIQSVEKKALHADLSNGKSEADRKWILKTFSECMMAVKQPSYYID